MNKKLQSSKTNFYKNIPDVDTKLEIYEYGSDAVEVKLINTSYDKRRFSWKLQFMYFNVCCTAYSLIVWFEFFTHFFYIDIFLFLWFIFLLWRLNRLVEFEKFIFCYDFGIHLQVQKYFGKRNRFLPSSYIHDIVINEVIENFYFRYLLILRTKGTLFHKKPIICIFTEFKPSFECLKIIYNHINQVIEKNARDSKSS